MVKQQVKLIIMIPVGPLGSRNQFRHILDTIASVVYYTTPDRRIVIQDNSYPANLGERIQAAFPEVTVLRTPENYGLYGGLYKAESIAFLHIHAAYDYKVLVRMDADALMIGQGLEDDAIDFFAKNPGTGQIGNYLTAGEGITWARQQLRSQMSMIGWLRDRARWAMIRRLVSMAQACDYQLGESILGGASIFSPLFVDRLVQQRLLLREPIRRARLQEDHIFSLLCKAVGMDLGDFGSPGKPMAIAWRGLPSSPQELVDSGKKIIHSTRFWKDMNEDQIREYFRNRRNSGERTEDPVLASQPEVSQGV